MSAIKEYFDADCAGYAGIEYWTSAKSVKSASEILNQIEWCDFIGTLQENDELRNQNEESITKSQ